ncbi:MAG: HAMP domain-containing sensor histidine kinase [Ruthenibacterium sp.]
MKKQQTLRFKLTLMTVCVLAVMCLVLTAISLSASRIVVQAIPTTPAQTTSDLLSVPAMELQPSVSGIKAQSTFNFIAVFSMFAVIVAGGAFVFFFVKRALMPLEELSQQVQTLDADTLATPLVLTATGDEIEQLSRAIRDMTVRVSHAYLMQKNFSASAAHELRTPLAAMQSKMDVFNMTSTHSDADYQALIDTLGHNTARLSALVVELLALTSHAEMDMSQTVNLRALAEEATMDLEPLASAKQVQIVLAGDASVTGNDGLLQRVMFNLMQNAIKYNVQGGSVTVTMTQHGTQAQLVVADTGIGIPDALALKERVFESFFRVETSRSRALGGNGLGLAIVKHIVTQHHGCIVVTDNLPQGTRMEVTL